MISPELYKRAAKAYTIMPSIRTVIKVLHVPYKEAKKAIEEGLEGFMPIKDMAEEIKFQEAGLDTKVSKAKDIKVKRKDEVSSRELYKQMFKAYQQKVIIWLKGGVTDEKGNFDPGVPIKFKELQEMIALGQSLFGEEEDEDEKILLPYKNMTDEEWEQLITGKRKPER